MNSIIKRFFFIILALFFLIGCTKVNKDSYDFVIVDTVNFSYLKKDKENLIKVSEKKREYKDRNLWYVNDQVFEKDNYYYGVTSENTNDSLAVYIEKIEKESFNVANRAKTNRLNAATLGNKYFYAVTNNVNEIVINTYDLDLTPVKTSIIKVRENAYHYPTDCIEIDDYLYMICGLSYDDKDFGYNENYILKFDSNLNLVKEYQLPKYDGSFFSMVNIENKIYLTQTSSGLKTANDSAGEYLTGDTGNQIWVFDIYKEEILDDETIQLSIDYPHNIKYDSKNNNFIIESGSSPTTANHIWAIYNLDSGEEKILPIDSINKLETQLKPAQFVIKDEWYYIVFEDELYEYNVESSKMNNYKFDNLSVARAHTLFFS